MRMKASTAWLILTLITSGTASYNIGIAHYGIAFFCGMLSLISCSMMAILTFFEHTRIPGPRGPAGPHGAMGATGAPGADGTCKCQCATKNKQVLLG